MQSPALATLGMSVCPSVCLCDLGWPSAADTHSVAEKMRLSEHITKIWMKIDPFCLQQKCRPMTLVSDSIVYEVYANIRGGSPGRGRQTTVELATTSIFSVFTGYSPESLEMRPALLYSNTQSVVSFSVIPKCMTLNDLEWIFRVKLCFRAALAGSDHATFENNCVKSNIKTVSGENLRKRL